MKNTYLFALCVALGMLGGCAGNGDSGGINPGTAQVNSFATDSLRTDYDHVWVKVFKVTLANGTDSSVVFDDANGRIIDLKTLRDGVGNRYSFFDSANVPAGTYTNVRVELDENLMIVPTGSNVAQNKKFQVGLAKTGAAGHSELVLPINLTLNPGENNLVLDFDLANWNVNANGDVSAVLKSGDGQGLNDRNRHQDEDYRGVIHNLAGTAPVQTFELSRNGQALTVRTDSNTSVVRESGQPNPVLSDGQLVQVRGTFTNGTLNATLILLDEQANIEPNHAIGVASSIDPNAGSFILTISECFRILPDRANYLVTTDGTTRFTSDAGVSMTMAEWFAALNSAGTNAKVEVAGTIVGTVFHARVIRLEDNRRNEAEVKGTVTAVSAAEATLSIRASRWEGINIASGTVVPVTTTSNTIYKVGGTVSSKDEFFATATTGALVEAEGPFNGTGMIANKLNLEIDR